MLYYDTNSHNFLFFDDSDNVTSDYYPVIIDNGQLCIMQHNVLVPVPDSVIDDISDDSAVEELLVDDYSYNLESDYRISISMFLLFFLFIFTLLSRLGDYK